MSIKDKREGYIEAMLSVGFSSGLAQNQAVLKYPPKTITRPRVVRSGVMFEWRILAGVLQWRTTNGEAWKNDDASAALLDLFANPTETVEVDE